MDDLSKLTTKDLDRMHNCGQRSETVLRSKYLGIEKGEEIDGYKYLCLASTWDEDEDEEYWFLFYSYVTDQKEWGVSSEPEYLDGVSFQTYEQAVMEFTTWGIEDKTSKLAVEYDNSDGRGFLRDPLRGEKQTKKDIERFLFGFSSKKVSDFKLMTSDGDTFVYLVLYERHFDNTVDEYDEPLDEDHMPPEDEIEVGSCWDVKELLLQRTQSYGGEHGLRRSFEPSMLRSFDDYEAAKHFFLSTYLEKKKFRFESKQAAFDTERATLFGKEVTLAKIKDREGYYFLLKGNSLLPMGESYLLFTMDYPSTPAEMEEQILTQIKNPKLEWRQALPWKKVLEDHQDWIDEADERLVLALRPERVKQASNDITKLSLEDISRRYYYEYSKSGTEILRSRFLTMDDTEFKFQPDAYAVYKILVQSGYPEHGEELRWSVGLVRVNQQDLHFIQGSVSRFDNQVEATMEFATRGIDPDDKDKIQFKASLLKKAAKRPQADWDLEKLTPEQVNQILSWPWDTVTRARFMGRMNAPRWVSYKTLLVSEELKTYKVVDVDICPTGFSTHNESTFTELEDATAEFATRGIDED